MELVVIYYGEIAKQTIDLLSGGLEQAVLQVWFPKVPETLSGSLWGENIFLR